MQHAEVCPTCGSPLLGGACTTCAPPLVTAPYGGVPLVGAPGVLPWAPDAGVAVRNPYSGQWNWGAALLNWIWLIGHKQYWWALAVVVLGFIPFAGLIVFIYLGIKGNDIAIQKRTFASDAQYVAVQNAWRNWGFIIFGLGIVLGVAGAMMGAASFVPAINAPVRT